MAETQRTALIIQVAAAESSRQPQAASAEPPHLRLPLLAPHSRHLCPLPETPLMTLCSTCRSSKTPSPTISPCASSSVPLSTDTLACIGERGGLETRDENLSGQTEATAVLLWSQKVSLLPDRMPNQIISAR
ncbi:unnamed protein product [Pleuronectes platessa]|uniref:Uncharacterized protein n=1 Tax=Pleuronectes platessa TaxID=8262 RepID=A0A9N7TPZ3_PLEPL|nr:unnamed protein product [Pleuronectes platessa]